MCHEAPPEQGMLHSFMTIVLTAVDLLWENHPQSCSRCPRPPKSRNSSAPGEGLIAELSRVYGIGLLCTRHDFEDLLKTILKELLGK